jgi:hypothetical protein
MEDWQRNPIVAVMIVLVVLLSVLGLTAYVKETQFVEELTDL